VKLVHLVGFIIKEICYDVRSHERKIRHGIYILGSHDIVTFYGHYVSSWTWGNVVVTALR
jgi:hypothetical protein